jgi:hypothetical protein
LARPGYWWFAICEGSAVSLSPIVPRERRY